MRGEANSLLSRHFGEIAASHTHPMIAGVGVGGVGHDHLLPAQREEAEVKQNGQAHAEQDAEHYPEKATPTQR